MFMLRLKPCQRKIATDEIQKRKIIESDAELSNIVARVSVH